LDFCFHSVCIISKVVDVYIEDFVSAANTVLIKLAKEPFCSVFFHAAAAENKQISFQGWNPEGSIARIKIGRD
jgi:hypothetical protein